MSDNEAQFCPKSAQLRKRAERPAFDPPFCEIAAWTCDHSPVKRSIAAFRAATHPAGHLLPLPDDEPSAAPVELGTCRTCGSTLAFVHAEAEASQ